MWGEAETLGWVHSKAVPNTFICSKPHWWSVLPTSLPLLPYLGWTHGFSLYRKLLISLKKIRPPVAQLLAHFSKGQFSFLNPKQDLVKIEAGTKSSFWWIRKFHLFKEETKRELRRFGVWKRPCRCCQRDLAKAADITLGISQKPSCLGNKSRFLRKCLSFWEPTCFLEQWVMKEFTERLLLFLHFSLFCMTDTGEERSCQGGWQSWKENGHLDGALFCSLKEHWDHTVQKREREKEKELKPLKQPFQNWENIFYVREDAWRIDFPSEKQERETSLQYGKQWKSDFSPTFPRGGAGRGGHYDVGEESGKRSLKPGYTVPWVPDRRALSGEMAPKCPMSYGTRTFINSKFIPLCKVEKLGSRTIAWILKQKGENILWLLQSSWVSIDPEDPSEMQQD